jgi:hypothetical protein
MRGQGDMTGRVVLGFSVLCVLCVSAVGLVVFGCKAPPAGRDAANVKATAVETNVERTVSETIQHDKNTANLRAENVGLNNNIFSGGAGVIMITQVAMIVGLFGFLTATARRMLAYREGLRVVQGAVKEANAVDVIERVKPRVKAMGRWRKKRFDEVLGEA